MTKLAVCDWDTPIFKIASITQSNYKAYHVETGKFLGDWVAQKDFFKQNKDYTKTDVRFEKEPEVITSYDVHKMAHKAISNNIKTTINNTMADDYLLVIQGEGNFRTDIATIKPYKGNRPKDKPILLPELKEWTASNFKSEVTQGEETDDVVAKYGWKALYDADYDEYKAGELVIMVHTDKDIDQVPGKHMNPDTGEIYYIDMDTACYNFLYSVLLGDSADNIPGIEKMPKGCLKALGVSDKEMRGVGEVTAKKLLELGSGPEDWWMIVVWCYKAAYEERWLEVLTENCRLLYLRSEDDEMYDVESILRGLNLC